MQASVAAALSCAAVATSCAAVLQPAPPAGNASLASAEAIIDAFYSFDPARLRLAMADAPGSQPQLLYYQGWAEGGHYKVLRREPCRPVGASAIHCSITVKDDLIAALGTGYDVTDTFEMTLVGGKIASIDNSSNDPPEFEVALDWLKTERPAMFTGPCKGFFKGGPTPQACVQAVVAGFREWRALPPS